MEHHALHGAGESALVVHRDQDAILLRDKILRTAAARGDHGKPRRHRFNVNDAERFAPRRQHKAVRRGVRFGKFLSRTVAAEGDAAVQPQFGAQSPQRAALRSIAENDKPRLAVQRSERMEKPRHVFHRDEIASRYEREALVRDPLRRKPRRIHDIGYDNSFDPGVGAHVFRKCQADRQYGGTALIFSFQMFRLLR